MILFWKTVFVATAGQLLGKNVELIAGPLGNVLAKGLHQVLKERAKPNVLPEDGRELAIIHCYIACLGKLANVDEHVCYREHFFVDEILRKKFRLGEEEFLKIKKVFDDASRDEASIDFYIEHYADLLEYSFNEAMNFITSLIAFANIDDNFCDSERQAIERAIKILKLPARTLDSILLYEKVAKNINLDRVKSFGSGFFINNQGYIITNCHVIEKCKLVKIRSHYDFYDAKVITKKKDYDLALLKIDADSQPVKFTNRPIKIGESIFTFGYPDPELQGYSPKITTGVISSLAGSKDHANYMQIDAAIQPGNSGCPVMDCGSGAVIGVASNGIPKSDKVNYAIKQEVARLLLGCVGQLADTLEYTDENSGDLPEIIEKVEPSLVQVFACK